MRFKDMIKSWAEYKISELEEERNNLKTLVCKECGRDSCGTDRTIDELDFLIDWIRHEFVTSPQKGGTGTVMRV